jgi:hypothetical protein
MKADSFEENLRKKLESIEPRFEESDWQQMQAHLRKNSPPTFWQQHGSLLSYLVGLVAVVSSVLLYHRQQATIQLLQAEVSDLKKNTAPTQVLWKYDTVYIERNEAVTSHHTEHTPISVHTTDAAPTSRIITAPLSEPAPQELSAAPRQTLSSVEVLSPSASEPSPQVPTTTDRSIVADSPSSLAPTTALQEDASHEGETSQIATRPLQPLSPISMTAYQPLAASFSRRTPAVIPSSYHEKIHKRSASSPALADASPPRESSAPKETTSPKLPAHVGYRVGIGQQWDSRSKALTLWNEVVLSEHFSAKIGISQRTLAEERFISENVFRERRKEDFRRKHAPSLPPVNEIFNIKTRIQLLQLPLTLHYRGSLAPEFSYLLGFGTVATLHSRQSISFDIRRPNQELEERSSISRPSMPIFGRALITAGIEKRWSPIILQAETYYAQPLRSPMLLANRRDFGIRVKLLYEIKTRN